MSLLLKNSFRRLFWALMACCVLDPTLVAVDAAGPPPTAHPHTGKVRPFSSGDPGVVLDRSAQQILSTGKPYQTQIQSGSSGRGLVVQDVQAPCRTVWDRILDFGNYPKMVPKTVESQIYRRENLRHGQERIWVRMKVGFPMLKLQFFINHLYDPHRHSMTWTLDYTRKSDLDDSVGYWYVIPHPDNPQHWSRVYYSVDVSMFSWVPKFVVDFMSKQALTEATSWVKRFSELEAAKKGATIMPRPFSGGAMVQEVRPSMTSSMMMTMEQKHRDRKVGLTRYALVGTVLALSFYNVHLYLSQ